MNKPSPASKASLVLNSLPATAMGFALCVQISALSWLLSTRYHLAIHEIGIVWAAGPVAGMLGQVLVGLSSDRTWLWGGRRRPFILLAGITSSLSLYLLTKIDKLAGALGIADLVIVAGAVALALDLSINIGLNPARALIADLTPEGESRTRGFSWMQAMSGFWGVVAYLIGAFIGNETLIQAGCLIVLVFACATLFVKEAPVLAKTETAHASVSTGTEWPELWKIWIAHGFAWFGIQAIFVYLIAFVQAYLVPAAAAGAAASGKVVAVSFAIMNVVGFIVPALALPRASGRFGRVRVHAACLALMAGACLAIALFARSQASLYVLMAVAGIGWGAVISLPFAIMSEKIDRQRMGFFMGIFNLSVVIPQLATTQVGFLLAKGAGAHTLFLISGTALLISCFLWTLVADPGAAPRQLGSVAAR
ncbi:MULTISPECIES: MFS transporter [unclassified Massilia]|uniref:MFS transporter n=1 Tax=unclassified Massilia TaxID=2609279 RepID=UPI001B82EFCD|nr:MULTISPECIES: MFS transporter [unclassified Massilia]MBQ5940033.1 MFS transporter [Massilia sp. AB1]MBQ5961865.1 MFS transporter [Massilia sp. ZL223]